MKPAKIHARDATGEPLCRAGRRWSSAVIASNHNPARVTCIRCQQRLADA